MSPEIKAKWVAALRSGEYMQGTGQLWIHNAIHPQTMCCLGVLKACTTGKETVRTGTYLDSTELVELGLTHEQQNELAQMNDGTDGANPIHQHSFEEIAQHIERTL